MKKIAVVILLSLLLTGCVTLGYRAFYEQVAPTKYPPTTKVLIFAYSNVDLNEIYQLLFNDFLIIGESGFIGPYEDPLNSEDYAKSIGTDIFITASQMKETKTSFFPLTLPTSSTTYISGYSGSGSVYGTATTYGTHTTTIPIEVTRYNQNGLYLRNVNKIIPLWDRKKQDYNKTGSSTLGGIWYNEDYEIDVYKSGEQMVGFIISCSKEKKGWDKDELKMIFGENSGTGVYLMSNKKPTPARFKINKFGHLEVELFLEEMHFSFAKK